MKENLLNNDSYLLLDLSQGKEKAFDFIFRKYYKALCAQANSYVSDLDRAQSLVQDCFIKLWEKRKEATTIESLPSYLSFMVRNKCIDHIRKEKHNSKLTVEEQEEADEYNSEDLLLSREFEEKFVQAMSQLPERCRVAFEHSRLEGLTYQEIASKMGISVKAVEALISRSLKILRTELKDYLPIVIILYRMIH